jgi:acyl-CoA synthetase
MEADFAFCFISKDDIPDELDKLGMKYFFTDELLQSNNLQTLRNSLDVFGRKIRFFKATSSSSIKTFNDSGDELNRLCYTITTSGTTGQRKVVRVTYNCITPNVVCLQQIFRLNKDVIYSSAPCTFDVFVLDLFMALHSGSALMIMDENLRYSEESMNLMFSSKSTGVTFLQITPSLFQQYGIENIQTRILDPDSSLK